jgi:hypothetical protein
MKGKIDRRRFLQYSGYGLATASASALLAGCGDSYNTTSEDDGYVLSYVYEPATHTSDLWIIDASDFMAGPVAKVKLPVRVPIGFHGVWVPQEQIAKAENTIAGEAA